jgi:hypothetical protein
MSIPPPGLSSTLTSALAGQSTQQILGNEALVAEISKLPEAKQAEVHAFMQGKQVDEQKTSDSLKNDSKIDNAWSNVDALQDKKLELEDKKAEADRTLVDQKALAQSFVKMKDHVWAHGLDCRLTRQEIGWLAAGDGPEKLAAQWLLDHPDQLEALLTSKEGPGGSATHHSLNAMNGTMQQQLRNAEQAVRDLENQLRKNTQDIERANRRVNQLAPPATTPTPNTPGTSGAPGTAGGPGTAGAPGTAGSPPASDTPNRVTTEATPTPARSNAPGMDGAVENLNNMVAWQNDEMSRLSNIASDPKSTEQEKAAAKTAMERIQRDMQTIMALLQQLSQMRSNMLKMYNDIASHIINNSRS